MIKVVSGYSISSQNSASPSAAEGAKRLANMKIRNGFSGLILMLSL